MNDQFTDALRKEGFSEEPDLEVLRGRTYDGCKMLLDGTMKLIFQPGPFYLYVYGLMAITEPERKTTALERGGRR